ncbi:MAG: thiamine diphosphokinase [Spirochaetes bacterium]|nr:thiamine diphosphokinase [Spirochaetota bacterium]
MPHALLVTGGEAPPSAAVLSRFAGRPFVCAADSGLDTLIAWGIEPDLIVGDMDSLSDPGILGRFKGPETVIAARDKDETDTELGLRLLLERGFDSVVIAGGGGGRLDHLLAIRALFERVPSPVEWISSRERIVLVGEPAYFRVEAGATVSVFPLAGGASGMRSQGLKWKLDGLAWSAGEYGISNVTLADGFFLDPGASPLLVVMPLDAVRAGARHCDPAYV